MKKIKGVSLEKKLIINTNARMYSATHKTACSAGNTLDLYSEAAQFPSQPGHLLS
jgi:hypothetical protein